MTTPPMSPRGKRSRSASKEAGAAARRPRSSGSRSEEGPAPAEFSLGDSFVRAGRTGAAIGKIYLEHRGVALLERRGPARLARAARSRWLERSAETQCDASVELGGLLLKSCQFLGSRADLFPPAFIDRLSRLQDRVPHHPYPVVRRVIREELGAPPEKLFRRFWRSPIASASLAQVHRAVLPDGRHVAVKVQRPEVPAAIRADLRNLRIALGAVERLEGPLGFGQLLDEIEALVPRELDFAREAESAQRLARDLAEAPGIRIPAPIPELGSPRVLVTEYVPGIKVTDRRRLKRAGIAPADVVSRLVDAYARQILERGFFHADPHPGNLLVVPGPDGPTLWFVDFGLVQELPPGFREGLIPLAVALVSGSASGVAAALAQLGAEEAEPEARTLERVGALLVEFVRLKQREETSEQARDLGRELQEFARSQAEVRFPVHLWLLSRVLGLLFGVAASLGERIDLVASLGPHLLRAR
jgi:ubiquinone biosynthesis protein